MEAIIVALIAGLVVGVAVGTLGAGGGVLSLPALVYILHQDPHSAAVGSLIIVVMTCLVALPHRIKNKQIKWQQGITFAAFSTIGSVIGARISGLITGDVLLGAFSLLAVSMAFLMIYQGVRLAKKERLSSGDPISVEQEGAPKNIALVALIAIVTSGLTTGIFGVGGGFMIVPMLTLALGLTMRSAVGTAQIVLIIASVAGIIGRIGMPHLQVDWVLIICFAVMSMLGGVIGGPLSARLRSSTLTFIFSGLLFFVAGIHVVDKILAG